MPAAMSQLVYNKKSVHRTLYRSLCGWVPLLMVVLAPLVSAEALPRPKGLQADVAFWRRVFTEVDADRGLIHDNRHLNVVYETIDLPKGGGTRQINRASEQARARYEAILRSLAKGKRNKLSAEEARVLALWPKGVSNKELRSAIDRLRMQQGMSSRFRAGLLRSGQWLDFIHDTFTQLGVPESLAAIPHVESSFDPTVYSQIGAAGLWQFTRATGQHYMQIDHVVDGRRDPYLSSVAAAELLKFNYSVLKSWPLAITAYNHGVTGMRRAVRELGTDDIEQIVRRYNGKAFGFASRNFYVAFLAALDVEQNVNKYFGKLNRAKPSNDLALELPQYVPAAALEKTFNISRETLRERNPALLEPVWNDSKYIPKGFVLRLPKSKQIRNRAEVLASISDAHRFKSQTPDLYHKVRRGDALSAIAARYDTTVTELVAWNNLSSRHLIRAGQVLRLPPR